LDETDVVQMVLPKDGMKARQYLSRVTRFWQKKGTKVVQELPIKVGEAVAVDWCPMELFVVTEIDGFINTKQPK
jgi:hypothetical protein